MRYLARSDTKLMTNPKKMLIAYVAGCPRGTITSSSGTSNLAAIPGVELLLGDQEWGVDADNECSEASDGFLVGDQIEGRCESGVERRPRVLVLLWEPSRRGSCSVPGNDDRPSGCLFGRSERRPLRRVGSWEAERGGLPVGGLCLPVNLASSLLLRGSSIGRSGISIEKSASVSSSE